MLGLGNLSVAERQPAGRDVGVGADVESRVGFGTPFALRIVSEGTECRKRQSSMHLNTRDSRQGEVVLFQNSFGSGAAPCGCLKFPMSDQIKFSFSRNPHLACLYAICSFPLQTVFTQCCSVLIRTCVSLSLIRGRG